MMKKLNDLWENITDSQVWKSIFRHGKPVDPEEPLPRGAIQRLPAPSSGADPQVGPSHALHLVHGRDDLLPLPRPDLHGPDADVLLPAHRRVRPRDIVDLRAQIPFGVMREIHRWGAHAMVITVWLTCCASS
jgi:hypothetical protein